MSDVPTAADAARNDAAWCDAMGRAHGAAGETRADFWWTRAPMPRPYPNLVTLRPAPAPALRAIESLVAAGLAGAWGVKDAFGVLDLAPLGFRLLLDGAWFGRPAARAAPERGDAALRWSRVDAAPALAAWATAWGESAGAAPIFLPALLARNDVAIVGWRAGAGLGALAPFGREALGPLRGWLRDDAARGAGAAR
ncbi:MAG: hypothetical protein DCC71_10655 [Proteobacteria bacterium]|nr:MAG: hypothetical protein DCC71_10655 [Pseudomonadota bacterium]